MSIEPAAWQYRGFNGQWFTAINEKHVRDYQAKTKCEIRPLFVADSFQNRVGAWMDKCFGPEISSDLKERNHRFLEEALELVQSCGAKKDEALMLVDYVYDRDQGEVNQEVGGVMVTLAALCLANGFDMRAAAETELARVWEKMEMIRSKQAGKPR